MAIPANVLIYDGDFSSAKPTGSPIPIFHYPSGVINLNTEGLPATHAPVAWKQQYYVQNFAYTAAPRLGDNTSVFGPSFYLVEETDPQDAGGGQAFTMWRTYAKIPPSTYNKVVATKTYQWANYSYTGDFNVIDVQVVSYTREKEGTMNLDYYENSFAAGNVPVHPFVQAVRFSGGSPFISDFGTGFPTTVLIPPGGTAHVIFTDNTAQVTPVSATIEPFWGRIVVRKIVYVT